MKNAAIMFSLIDNVGTITVHLSDGSNVYDISNTRENVDAFLGKDVKEYAKTQDGFSRFLLEFLQRKLNKMEILLAGI